MSNVFLGKLGFVREDQDRLEYMKPEFSADKRLKDPNKIESDLLDKKLKWIETTQENIFTNKFVMFGGYAFDINNVTEETFNPNESIFHYYNDEKTTMENFSSFLEENQVTTLVELTPYISGFERLALSYLRYPVVKPNIIGVSSIIPPRSIDKEIEKVGLSYLAKYLGISHEIPEGLNYKLESYWKLAMGTDVSNQIEYATKLREALFSEVNVVTQIYQRVFSKPVHKQDIDLTPADH